MNYEQKLWVCIVIANLWSINGNNYIAMAWAINAVLFMILQYKFEK